MTAIFPQVNWGDVDYAWLRMRLDLYDDMVVATRYQDNEVECTFVVNPTDLAAELGKLDISSGLLPEGCLFWQRREGRERVGIYVPPQVRTLHVMPTKKANRRIPLPGLVFVGHGRQYEVYAVTERPSGPEATLYRAPLPNVSGTVCQGEVEFPEASPATIWAAFEAFIGSGFNNHLINGKSLAEPENILKVWRELHDSEAEAWPVDDLVEIAWQKFGRLL